MRIIDAFTYNSLAIKSSGDSLTLCRESEKINNPIAAAVSFIFHRAAIY